MRAPTIGFIRQIPVRVHWSFLLALPLIVFALGSNLIATGGIVGLPRAELSGGPWLWGLGLTILLFGSVLLHELAHALYARRRGAQVLDIVLLPIGGVSRIAEPPKHARYEAIMAVAGPATSLALAAAGFLLFALARRSPVEVAVALFSFAQLNLLIGLFNLLPAFPMDGGRILRGLLTPRLGPMKATRVAAIVGKVFAALFVVVGLFGGGFFLSLIGIFVFLGAEAETRTMELRSALDRVRVRELMTPAAPAIEAEATVADAAERMVADKQLACPIVHSDGAILGIVTLRDLAAVPRDQRTAVRTAAVARQVPPVTPGDEVWRALRTMSDKHVPLLPVVDEGRLVGTLEQSAIVRDLEFRKLADHGGRRAA